VFGLSGFSWAAWWSPWMILFFGAIAAGYVYITGPGRFRVKDAEPVSKTKKFWFLSGVFFLYLAFGSPIDLLGHLMFSFHMVSMACAYIIAAPMLLAGTPEWLLRPIGRIPGIRGLRFMVNPIVTLLLFNLVFSIYHIPVVHDYVMTHYSVHTLYYIVLLISGILMWFPVVNPLNSQDRLPGFKKMGYVFANSVLLTPACALIIFAPSSMYASYTDPVIWAQAMGYCLPKNSTAILSMFSGPSELQWMDPMEDQRIGGIVMKLVQEVVYGVILCYVFLQWYRKENPKGESDSLDPSPIVLERMKASAEPLLGK
jgi:putative membrane protein